MTQQSSGFSYVRWIMNHDDICSRNAGGRLSCSGRRNPSYVAQNHKHTISSHLQDFQYLNNGSGGPFLLRLHSGVCWYHFCHRPYSMVGCLISERACPTSNTSARSITFERAFSVRLRTSWIRALLTRKTVRSSFLCADVGVLPLATLLSSIHSLIFQIGRAHV